MEVKNFVRPMFNRAAELHDAYAQGTKENPNVIKERNRKRVREMSAPRPCVVDPFRNYNPVT